jgi:hypothetical protein
MYFKTLKETSVFMEEPLVISWFFLGFLAFEIFARLGFGAGTTKKLFSRSVPRMRTYGMGVIEF